MNRNIMLVLAVVVALGVGGLAGYWFAGSRATAIPMPAEPQPEAREVLYYRNPMNPAITSPVPAQDEMGMDYIPVYSDSMQMSGPAGTVRVDPVTVQSMGVRTTTSERRTLSHSVFALGRVAFDERSITRLHPRTQGWIEELYVEETGERINPDHILLSIYAPQLVSTQQEYLLALRNLATLQSSPFPDVRRGAEELVETALERLRLLGVPEHQIAELKSTQQVRELLHIHSPAGGIVTTVGVREGQYVTPQTELFVISDLSRVWALVDIFEDELPWVKVGNEASMTIASAPGQSFEGQLTYVYPYAERQTRTIKARLEFDNKDLLLKPDMIANITIEANPQTDVVAVPTEAILRSGLRDQVFVVREPGRFEPREVTVGVSSDGWTEIRDGLEAGEAIVSSGQFLIDSESKLREATAKMLEQAK